MSNPDAGFVTGSQGAVATAAQQVTPRERYRHALTTADATKMVEQHRRQRVTKGAGFQTLDEHGHRSRGGLPSTTGAASPTSGHVHSTPRAERMAREMSSTSPTPLMRWSTPARS
jgi:hypothetical protein